MSGSSGEVGLGGRTAALSGEGDEVEGLVELAVTAAVEAVAGLVLPGGGFYGGGAGEAGKGGFGAAPARVGPGEVA